MASLVKPWITRYVDEDGKRVPKDTPGARKVKQRSKVWYGQFKGPSGKYRRVPIYTDKAASQAELAKLIRHAERGEAGLTDPYEDSLTRPIADHVRDYLAALQVKGADPKHFSERRRILNVVFKACQVETLADLTADRVDAYIAGKSGSSRTKDTHRGAVHAFGEWLEKVKRWPENTIRATAKPKGKVEHPRRAETAENLQRLLEIARERPLIEATIVRKGSRAGERYADVRPEVRDELLRVGRERALLYKTAILTGMRQGELRRLQANHLRLDDESPAVYVAPAHNRKNKTGIWLPLLPEHAAELRGWCSETGKAGTDLVFYVPEKPNKIFRRDLKMAGIPYKDEEGHYFDFHALRHCTDTYLNASGVPPTVVMLFMRHRHIKLSLQTYNDPRMHDARRALEALPKLA